MRLTPLVPIAALGLGYAAAARADRPGIDEVLPRAEAALPADPQRAIELLRDWRDAPEAACVLGRAHAAVPSPAHAYFFLKRCSDRGASEADRMALGRVRKVVRGGEFAPVLVSATPAEAEIEIEEFLPEVDVAPDGEVWLPFGTYTVNARLAGHDLVTHTLEIDSLDRQILNLALSRREDAPTSSEVDFSDSDGPSEAGTVEAVADPRPKEHESLLPDRYRRAPDPEAPGDSDGSARAWGTPLIVVGAGLVTGGVVLHISAASANADADDLPAGPERDDRRDTASTRNTIGYVMDGAGVAAIAVGVYLLLSAPDRAPDLREEAPITLVPTTRGLGAMIRF